MFLEVLLGPLSFGWMVYSGRLNLRQIANTFSHLISLSGFFWYLSNRTLKAEAIMSGAY